MYPLVKLFECNKFYISIDSDMRGKKFDGQIDELSKKCLRDGFLYKGMEALFTIDGKQGGKQNIQYRKSPFQNQSSFLSGIWNNSKKQGE